MTILALAFTVLLDGHPVNDAEICIAKGIDFAAQDFTCAASPVIPDGDWTAFARRGDDQISDAVLHAPGTFRLVRARRVDPSPDVRFAYVPRTRSAIPILDRAPDELFSIPLTVKDGRIVRVGEGGNAVVVPVGIEHAPSHRYGPPVVTVVDSAGKVHKPIAPVSKAADGTELVFFRDVPMGKVEVRAGGDGWKSAATTITADASVVTIEKPLMTAPASKLVVNWWLARDPSELLRPVPACNASDGAVASKRGSKFQITLARCDDPIDCTAVVARRELPLDARRGSVVIEELETGSYRLDMEYPRLEKFFKNVDIVAGDVTRTDYEVRWRSIVGRVTVAGKPAHVRLFDTVTDPETGEYYAAYERIPHGGYERLHITPCNGSPKFETLFSEQPDEDARFDIDIPANRLLVDVLDAASGEAVVNAAVTVRPVRDAGFGRVLFPDTRNSTNQEGRVELGPVQTDRRVTVCAQHPRYESRCSEPLQMTDAGENTVRLELRKREERPGRVVVRGDILDGRLFFVDLGGRPTEVLTVQPDGSFTFAEDHDASETVGFVSRSHPLYVFRLGRPLGKEAFEIVVPNAPARTFAVAIGAAARPGTPLISVGSVVIPYPVLGQHLRLLGEESRFAPGSTTVIRNVLESEPISVGGRLLGTRSSVTLD